MLELVGRFNRCFLDETLDSILDVILNDSFTNTFRLCVVFSKSNMTYYYPNLRYRIYYPNNGETYWREIVVVELWECVNKCGM